MVRLPIGLALCLSLTAQAPATEATRLSLQEAIRTSLQNNLQVEIAQQARQQTKAGILTSEGVFDWNLSASLQASQAKNGTSMPVGVGYPNLPYLSTSYNRGGAGGGPEVDLKRTFTWGGSLDLGYNATYTGWNSTLFNPVTSAPMGTSSNPAPYAGNLTATYSQNLLQGFGREVTTAPLVIARMNGLNADCTFEAAIINLASTTEGFYWNLVYAQRWLATKKLALELAQKHLEENRFRLKIGTIARLDVTGAEAQVAQAEQDILAAQAQLDNAKDTLVRALYPNAERPAALEATDAPDLSHLQLNEADAVKMALERRVELKAARIGKDAAQLQRTVAADRTRPSLQAFAQYNGNSGTYASLGPVNKDLATFKFPGYVVGATYGQPLQNRTALGNLASAQATLRSSELSLKDQELSIVLQVRTALRNVEAAEKGVKAAEKTRYFLNKTLEAEQFKFSRGVSTSFVILQDMTSLDNARSAEIQAQIAYANAVTALEQAVGNLLQARHLELH